MSQIDGYRHKLLAFMDCPTDYPSALLPGRTSPIPIALYQLEEPAEEWAGKTGDLLLGGGSGECPVFRVSLPETAAFLAYSSLQEFNSRSDLYQSYWRPEKAFALCNGFLKLGWDPAEDVETWLAEKIVDFMSSPDPTDSINSVSLFRAVNSVSEP